jgi:hypothetical protein
MTPATGARLYRFGVICILKEASAMRASILIALLAAMSACSVRSERVEQPRPATTTQQTTTVAPPAGPAVTTTTTTPAR